MLLATLVPHADTTGLAQIRARVATIVPLLSVRRLRRGQPPTDRERK